MFDKVEPEGSTFVEEKRKERDKRRELRLREQSALSIQKHWRGYRDRAKALREFRSHFDALISSTTSAIELLCAIRYLSYKFRPHSEQQRFELLMRHIMSTIETKNSEISYLSLALRKATLLEWISVSKWILTNILHYVPCIDPCASAGIKVVNIFLSFILVLTDYSRWSFYEEHLKPHMHQLSCVFLEHMIQHQLFPCLHDLLFKGLARHTPAFTNTTLTGIFILSMRPLIYSNFERDKILSFASNLLTVPGLILHISSTMGEAYEVIVTERLCSKTILSLYANPSDLERLISTVEGSYLLCLIGNLIQLSLLEEEVLALHCSHFCVVLSKLMRHLGSYVGNKKSKVSTWHPILGWFAQTLDNDLLAAMPFVTKQLRLLWNNRMVHLLFGDLYAQAELDNEGDRPSQAASTSKTSKVPSIPSGSSYQRSNQSGLNADRSPDRVRHGLGHFLGQLAKRNRLKVPLKKLNGDDSSLTRLHSTYLGPHNLPHSLKAVCMLYCFTVGSLRQIRNDILAGLSLGDLMPRMWRLIARCGDVRAWVRIVLDSKPSWQIDPHASHLLQLFTASASNLLSILDDVELFELQKSFTLDELCSIGTFFNHLIYETTLAVPDPSTLIESRTPRGCVTKSKPSTTPGKVDTSIPNGTTDSPCLFSLCLRLLSIVRERDNRHPFTDPAFWLIPGLKVSAFLADLRKPKPHAVFLLKHVPHIIPHRERVLLFRDRVREDKTSLGVQTRMSWLTDDGPVGAVITVHRNRLVEDGYQQLANLSSAQLRMKIRVQFVNEMGLDEVGLDLDGVFKEFLEESIHRVFDPSLNLFRITSDQRLYPSPTSHLQDNHLLLFEFLGKMLAKAIYEGIVIDVPFANFFLTQLLGREKAGCYSFLDELATLDKELYKSLSYIKHYEGDVGDLEFTYSYAEDCLGQVVVHDLCPDGRYITVTNDLKISYVHRVAHFRMYKQIRAQTASFIRGFYSILNPDWLAMFSPPELQKLISGDCVSVNIDDLRQNTRYSGGFHGNHRVIKWLWEILRRDFTDEERSLFLKFVTSCSRPPLLGFANLEPPFCIRCVQYSNEDHDVGDTLGSILKGFFGVGARREETSRLPTTSTCFNLLKLPNYSSRSVLRDKLRYAIHSHAGFELS